MWDFVSNEYGKRSFLTPQFNFNETIDCLYPSLAETFYLSQGERQLLITADVGEDLFRWPKPSRCGW